MPTQVYKVKGKRVPSVTTIIGNNLGWNNKALLGWGRKMFKNAMEDIKLCIANGTVLTCPDIDDIFDMHDPNKKRDKAADLGTLCHEFVEAYIYGAEVPDDMTDGFTFEELFIAQRGVEQFQAMEQEHVREWLETEYPLVSEEYQFGGCLDGLFIDHNGDTVLYDTKTSKGIYPSHIVQLAAYDLLLREEGKYLPKKYMIGHIDKDIKKETEDVVSFIPINNEILELGRKVFIAMASIHGLDRKLTINK